LRKNKTQTMGFWDSFIRSKQVQIIEREVDNANYTSESVGNIDIPVKLKDDNTFLLANTVSEIYHPIDFIADRASKLRFFISDKNGKEIEQPDYTRFLKEINPLYSFSDLFYQAVFSYLSTGNVFSYATVPSSYRKPSISSISRIDILRPDLIAIKEYRNVSPLKVMSFNDLIEEIRYYNFSSNEGYFDRLPVPTVKILQYDQTRQEDSQLLARSPLFKSVRSINNLLACYSARYNVYANNGAAGYLVKKTNSTGIDAAVGGDREDILKDINNRNGITGRRNFWGISGVPLEFVNTLADIQKLMPFDETLEDTIKIASTFQIPAVLASRKDQSTFDNQETAERVVWENTIMSVVQTVCEFFTKTAHLDKAELSIQADYSTVSCLQTNETQRQAAIAAELANVQTLAAIAPETDTKKLIEKIMIKYDMI